MVHYYSCNLYGTDIQQRNVILTSLMIVSSGKRKQLNKHMHSNQVPKFARVKVKHVLMLELFDCLVQPPSSFLWPLQALRVIVSRCLQLSHSMYTSRTAYPHTPIFPFSCPLFLILILPIRVSCICPAVHPLEVVSGMPHVLHQRPFTQVKIWLIRPKSKASVNTFSKWTEIDLNKCKHFLKANWGRSKRVRTLSQSELRSI